MQELTGKREKPGGKTSDAMSGRRGALLAFFVYPLVAWVPLLMLLYTLDMMKIDMRGNGIGKNALVFGLLALIYYLTRKIGVQAYYAFLGTMFWLAGIIGVAYVLS